jgi:hypothetical protein
MKKILTIASLLCAAVMCFSCGETPGGETTINNVTLSSDRNVIKCDGIDASTLVLVDDEGKVITDGIEFYDNNMNAVTLKNGKFTADEAGEYTIWAAYKTFNSNQITIKAINADIPAPAADPKPAETSFVKRVLLTQFTGTGCGFCPGMVNWLNLVRADEAIKKSTVHAAIHSYASGDPAYISSPQPGAFGATYGFPYLNIDMETGTHYSDDYTDEEMAGILKDVINEMITENPATAAISANPVYAENVIPTATGTSDGYIVTTSVKVSESGNYFVGAWLLEDNIFGTQNFERTVTKNKNYDYDTHHNCVRTIESYNGKNYAGYPLGKLQKGSTANMTFLLKVKKDDPKEPNKNWKKENMHLVVFVTKENDKGKYTVNNVIDCPVDAVTPFEYAN